jgi:glutaredoxin-like YruB-family protein
MPKVTVYSTSTCPYCRMAKDYLAEKRMAFEDFDVAADREKAREMMEKSGQTGVPVIDIDGKVIVGFDKEEIAAALGLGK